MPGPEAKFERPPVVETVLSAQFEPLSGFTGAHAGWFWRELGQGWPRAEQGVAVADHFERFPGEFTMPGVRLLPAERGQSEKYLLIRADDQRVIQLQQTRFLYNWRKRTDEYPSYDVVRPEFDELFSRFQAYVNGLGLGPLALNQWEITYLNHIPKGELWNVPRDWTRVIPAVGHPSKASDRLDACSAAWRFEIPPQRGRLHISVRHAWGAIGEGAEREFMLIELTARGPVRDSGITGLYEGLFLGHSEIVSMFVEMSSPEAHRHWGRLS